jgi:hypothetical protein
MKHISLKAVAIAALALGAGRDALLAQPAGPAAAQESGAITSVSDTQGMAGPGFAVIEAPHPQDSVDSPGLAGPGALSAAGLALAALGLMASLRRKRIEH